MMRSEGFDDTKGRLRCQLFEDELYGINDTIERLVDYFKVASAGSEVGRRLVLLLGPPSGGESSLVILLKRGNVARAKKVLEYTRRIWRREVRLHTVNERSEPVELAA